MLAGGDAHWLHRRANACVSKDVVGAGWLFHPPRIEFSQRPRARHRLIDTPLLVGIHHELVGPADLFTHNSPAAKVARGVAADLELEMRPAFSERLAAQRADLLIAESKPANRSGVRRIAVTLQLRDPLVSRRAATIENLARLLGAERVIDVLKLDRGEKLFGVQIGEQLPKGLVFRARVEVPHRIDERARGKMDHALLRP